jgi:pentatricopeptide repeat protein
MSAKDSKIRPNSESVNKVLSVIATHVPSQTQSFYEFISNHESLVADFKPDANTYRARIEGAVRSRDLLTARELVEEMRAKGIEANIDVHTILFWGKYKQDWEPWLDALASRRNQKKSFFQEYSERKMREQSREQSENEFIATNSIQEEQFSDFLKTLN